MSAQELAIVAIINAINAWLAITGSRARIAARDVRVTHYDDRMVLDFKVTDANNGL